MLLSSLGEDPNPYGLHRPGTSKEFQLYTRRGNIPRLFL